MILKMQSIWYPVKYFIKWNIFTRLSWSARRSRLSQYHWYPENLVWYTLNKIFARLSCSARRSRSTLFLWHTSPCRCSVPLILRAIINRTIQSYLGVVGPWGTFPTNNKSIKNRTNPLIRSETTCWRTPNRASTRSSTHFSLRRFARHFSDFAIRWRQIFVFIFFQMHSNIS